MSCMREIYNELLPVQDQDATLRSFARPISGSKFSIRPNVDLVSFRLSLPPSWPNQYPGHAAWGNVRSLAGRLICERDVEERGLRTFLTRIVGRYATS